MQCAHFVIMVLHYEFGWDAKFPPTPHLPNAKIANCIVKMYAIFMNQKNRSKLK